MIETLYLKARTLAYALVRPLLVGDIDPNEDFRCGHCGRDVLRRVLFCSLDCAKRSEEFWGWYSPGPPLPPTDDGKGQDEDRK
jgi:hypothetical protein